MSSFRPKKQRNNIWTLFRGYNRNPWKYFVGFLVEWWQQKVLLKLTDLYYKDNLRAYYCSTVVKLLLFPSHDYNLFEGWIVELLKCLVSVVQECNRLGKKVPHSKTLSNEHSVNRDTKVEINGLHLGILNWFAAGVSRKQKLRTPNEAFFHRNPELLGLGRQIGKINSGAFGVIFGKNVID